MLPNCSCSNWWFIAYTQRSLQFMNFQRTGWYWLTRLLRVRAMVDFVHSFRSFLVHSFRSSLWCFAWNYDQKVKKSEVHQSIDACKVPDTTAVVPLLIYRTCCGSCWSTLKPTGTSRSYETGGLFMRSQYMALVFRQSNQQAVDYCTQSTPAVASQTTHD